MYDLCKTKLKIDNLIHTHRLRFDCAGAAIMTRDSSKPSLWPSGKVIDYFLNGIMIIRLYQTYPTNIVLLMLGISGSSVIFNKTHLPVEMDSSYKDDPTLSLYIGFLYRYDAILIQWYLCFETASHLAVNPESHSLGLHFISQNLSYLKLCEMYRANQVSIKVMRDIMNLISIMVCTIANSQRKCWFKTTLLMSWSFLNNWVIKYWSILVIYWHDFHFISSNAASISSFWEIMNNSSTNTVCSQILRCWFSIHVVVRRLILWSRKFSKSWD